MNCHITRAGLKSGVAPEQVDPELEKKIQELHRRRNELNPDVARTLAEVPGYEGAGA